MAYVSVGGLWPYRLRLSLITMVIMVSMVISLGFISYSRQTDLVTAETGPHIVGVLVLRCVSFPQVASMGLVIRPWRCPNPRSRIHRKLDELKDKNK